MAIFTEKISTPYRKVIHRSIPLQGRNVEYDAIAEDHFIKAEDGQDAYSIFTFSYIRTNGEKDRPVIFLFNGGPGSSSSWLHMGFYGPRIMKLDPEGMPLTDGPYELRDNEQCLLDIADLVIIDPVNAGFSRLFDAKYAAEFLNDLPDAVSVSKVIRHWLAEYHREDSVKYFSGESFGSTRASLLAYLLRDCKPIGGEIHIGPGYTGNQDSRRNEKDLIPLAATKWYYERKKESLSGAASQPPLETWMKSCYEFLYHQYLTAYYLGHECPQDLYADTAEKLSYFTGLPAQYYMENGLWVSREYFRAHFLEREGKKLGSYDTRFTLPSGEQEDPFMAAFNPPINACMALYLKEELDLGDIGRLYRLSSFSADEVDWDEETEWKYESDPDMAHANALAYRENPDMRFFFGTGWYDSVATVENTRFAVTHTDIPLERVTMKNYESGHAVYADEASRRKLAGDIREFLLAEKK